jgi:hypothetical protein
MPALPSARFNGLTQPCEDQGEHHAKQEITR